MSHIIADHADPPCPTGAAERWQRVLDTLRVAATDAGANVADWWAQDTVGGRASGDIAATARMILAGIDDGDPLILDALPGRTLSGRYGDTPTDGELYTDVVPADAPGWDTLDAQARAQAIDAFRDGYHIAVQDRVAEHCRNALPNDDDESGKRRAAA